MTIAQSDGQRTDTLQLVKKGIRHPRRAVRAVGRRIQALLIARLIDYRGDPASVAQLTNVLRQTEILYSIHNRRPICLDCGDQAMIVYPQHLHVYFYEDHFMKELFQKALRPGYRVADLGAHNGYYSILAAREVGAKGQVFAFEPDPTNYKTLRRNLKLNELDGVVVAEEKCVGDKTEFVNIYSVEEGSRSSSITIHPEMHIKSTAKVECVSLDDYFADGDINVIKMDVEGNELRTLQGMQGVLSRSKNVVIFAELHPTMLAGRGVAVNDYLAMFVTLGFELKEIVDNARTLRPVSQVEIEAHARDIYWHTNLMAVKNS